MINEPANSRPYASPIEHLQDALMLTRLHLQRHLLLFTDRYLDSHGEYSSAFVSRREVEAFLGLTEPEPEIAEQVSVVDGMLDEFRAMMSAREEATDSTALRLPLRDLRDAFHLDDAGLDLLVALAAPEIDTAFARAYSHAWADSTRRHVDTAFLMDLIGGLGDARDRAWALLQPGSALIELGLVEVGTLPDLGSAQRWTERPVKLVDRAVGWLRGDRTPELSSLRGAAILRWPDPNDDTLLLPDDARRSVRGAVEALLANPQPRSGICLLGGAGVGKKSALVSALGGRWEGLLVVDLHRLDTDEDERRTQLRTALREALLARAALYFKGLDEPGINAQSPVIVALREVLAAWTQPFFVGTSMRIRRLVASLGELYEVEIPFPEMADQATLWRRSLGAATAAKWDFSLEDLVNRYSLSGGSILACCDEVARWSRAAGPTVTTLPLATVLDAIRSHIEHRLSSVAVPVQKGEGWNDIVLPDRTLEQLKEISSFFRHRHRIMRDWGLGAKLLKVPGIPCMFCGPPGTGKTMAASIIARELGREVFQVDLSRVVDKYIGETEKNLGRIFEEGSRAQSVLLFDEADSLFARRTEVSTSVDRYANLEVNFLLQRVEAYEGIVVLTSNFPQSIDEAFRRRLRFWVEFPFPEAEERARIWKVLIPPQVPLADDVDLHELAQRYELSGGHIKNIIIRAATMASENDRIVDQATLCKAGDVEYRLVGKLVRELDTSAF